MHSALLIVICMENWEVEGMHSTLLNMAKDILWELLKAFLKVFAIPTYPWDLIYTLITKPN